MTWLTNAPIYAILIWDLFLCEIHIIPIRLDIWWTVTAVKFAQDASVIAAEAEDPEALRVKVAVGGTEWIYTGPLGIKRYWFELIELRSSTCAAIARATKSMIGWRTLIGRFRIQGSRASENVRSCDVRIRRPWGKEEEGKADRYRRDEKMVSAFAQTD